MQNNTNESRGALRALFEAALEVAPSEREQWLNSHCDEARDRLILKRMLTADEATSTPVVDSSVDALLGNLGNVEAEDPPHGTQIGGFTLGEKLGEGGSSLVFLAHREQAGVVQRVALKLLRRNLYTPDEQRRFRDERRALSQLDHPGIARLIEGGLTDSGTPYIALELVEGESILDHARSHALDIPGRLRLFMAVCRAVEAAHRALIVHRDLKPSNVMVTAHGDVKLLDFGIAKLLDSEDKEHTQHHPMTPAYAAPEQFTGGQITTATDVYALGVLLAELVTGRRHESGDSRTPSGQITDIGDTQAQVAAARALRRRLRGDLDNIVLKATASEPERRYASAGTLADDIQRHLADEPVTAHPPSSVYRARKFIDRHRGGVATTIALLLAVFASLGLALWQADVARQQAHLAVQQAERAQAVRDLLVDLFNAEIPSRPRAEMPGTAELLEQGAQRALHDLSAKPAVQSDLLVALGRVYDRLALPGKSEPLLDAAIAAARRVEPPDPALLGAALSERGELELTRDHFAPALVYLDQAIALQRQAEPRGLDLADTLHRRARAESRTGHHDIAIVDYRAALAIRRERLPADDPEILDSYASLGVAYNRAGHPERATDLLRRALKGARRDFGENHVKTAHYLKNYAMNQGMLRHYVEAAALTEQAVRIERTLYPPGSPDIANGLNNLGALDITLGRLRAAREVLSEGRKLNRDAGLDESLGQTFILANLARVDEVLDDRKAALNLLREAERTATKVAGANPARMLSLELQRAHLEFSIDPAKAKELEALTQRVLDHPEQLAQFRARSEIEAGYSLGLAQAAIGQDQKAGETLQRTVDALPADHVDPQSLPAIVALARWQHAHGKDAKAQALLRGVIERASRELPATHYALGELHLELAELLASQHPRKAVEQADAAERCFGELPVTHPWRQQLVDLRQRLQADGKSGAPRSAP